MLRLRSLDGKVDMRICEERNVALILPLGLYVRFTALLLETGVGV